MPGFVLCVPVNYRISERFIVKIVEVAVQPTLPIILQYI